jgi:hypothetical protein
MLKLIFQILALILALNFQNIENCKEWSVNDKLTWKDFKGVMPKNEIGRDAIASTEIKRSFHYNADSIFIKVSSIFNKESSSAKLNMETDYGLNHEQVHFDITEYSSRVIRRKLCLTKLNRATAVKEMNLIFYGGRRMCDSLQEKYDFETKHSIDTVEQKKWNVFVETNLEDLRAYSSSSISLKLW